GVQPQVREARHPAPAGHVSDRPAARQRHGAAGAVKKRLAIALAATLVSAAAMVEPTSAGRPVQLISTGKAVWPARGFVVSLRAGQRIQSSRYSVLENGRPVLGASVVPASAVRGSFGAMLVIDTSNSMRG